MLPQRRSDHSHPGPEELRGGTEQTSRVRQKDILHHAAARWTPPILLTPTHLMCLCVYSASVNNLQAKVDVLEKSNTKLTEEVRFAPNKHECLKKPFCLAALCTRRLLFYMFTVCLCSLQWQTTESSLYKRTWREWRRRAPISWSPGR